MWLDGLKKMKAASGLTTKEIAAGAGVPEPTLEKIFAGVTKDIRLETARRLVHFFGFTLDDLEGGGSKVLQLRPDMLRHDELEHMQKYRALDDYGKEAVSVVLSVEYRRVQEAETPKEIDSPPVPILEFLLPVSAGYGIPLDAEGATKEIKVVSNIYTNRADFVLRVDGSSMEPRYHHQDRLLVEETDEIETGEIGIFVINGEGFVKKKGEASLLSLNRNYPDIAVMDVDSQRCVGRVVGILDPSWVVEE